MSQHRDTRSRRGIIAGAGACAVALVCPGPAAAHAIVVSSRPAAGATVTVGPVEIELVFNSRIDRMRSRIEATGPSRGPEPVTLTESGPDRLIGRYVTRAPGPHRLRWQVLAGDGHITRGDIAFTAAVA